MNGGCATRRHSGWSTLIGLLAVLGLVGLAAAQQPKYGGTLHVAWESEMTGFDPHWSPGLQVQYMVGNLFNSLLTIDEHLNYIPELAESWEMQDNGKVYVFGPHKDPKIDALWDQLKVAPTPEEFSRLSQEVQRYVLGNMVQMSATILPFIQAARDSVKGYVCERCYKLRFTTTWLDK